MELCQLKDLQEIRQRLHLKMVVDPLTGPTINGAMMKITMKAVTGMVELVVSIMLLDGTTIAQYANYFISPF